jgi:excisionase family DNA binding protein
MNQPNAENQQRIERLAWTLREAAERVGVSVPFLRKRIYAKEITPTMAGRRVLIADAELKRYFGLDRDRAAA